MYLSCQIHTPIYYCPHFPNTLAGDWCEICDSLGTVSQQSAPYVTHWKIILASYKIHIAINCCYLDFHWEFCINIVCPQGSSNLCSAVCRPYGCTCTQFICIRSTGWSLGLCDKSMHTEINVLMNYDAIFCYPFHLWWPTCTVALDVIEFLEYVVISWLTRPQSCTQLFRK